jgi:hypothetical protein
LVIASDTCGGNEKFKISWRFDYIPNAQAIIQLLNDLSNAGVCRDLKDPANPGHISTLD